MFGNVFTHSQLLLFDSVLMVDYFVIIFHMGDPVAGLLQLTVHHSLDLLHPVGGFHQNRVKPGGEAGEALCGWRRKQPEMKQPS